MSRHLVRRCLVSVSLPLVAFFATALPAVAQQPATVQGTITDSASQSPLEGVQVFIAGTELGTLTDSDGRYVLTNVPAGTVTLRIRRIGYGPVDRQLSLSAGEIVQVDQAMLQVPVELAELVAVGYGERERTALSTAVSSVRAEEVQNVPIAGVDGALQGKAAGVQVTQNAGNPGNGITVRVRGSASISAGNQPLYVVDGVPVLQENFTQLGLGGQDVTAVTGLSPADIESIDILKDAAAAAIYGSRGSNGVILIRTKRGSAGRPVVTFDSYVGTQSASDEVDLLSSTQYLEFFNESAENDGYGTDFYGVIGVDDSINTDWQDAILRSAPIHSVGLSVSGGDPRVRYYISGTQFDQGGIILGSAYARQNLRANLDFDASDRVALRTSVALSRESTDRIENDGSSTGIVTNAIGNPPLYPVLNPDGSFFGVADGLEYPNSVALGTLNSVNALTQRALGNIEARLTLSDRVRATGRFAFDALSVRENQWESARISGTFGASTGGIAKTGYSTGNRYTLEGFVEYGRAFGADALNVTAGTSLELNDGELNFVRGEGFSNDHFRRVTNAARIVEGDANFFEHNLVSFFARATYDRARKYFFTGSVRTDGSSRFGDNNRYGVFPAASFGWVVSQEPFLRDSDFIRELRLRLSYGVTGNQEINDYPYQGLFGSENYVDEAGLAPSRLPNPDLKWETTRELNLGFDAVALNGRVGLAADYYIKNTTDLLLDRPITSTSGFTSVFANVGELENKGFELTLNTVNAQSERREGFRWTTSLNLSINRNEVTKLFNNEPFNTGERDINRVQVGEPLGAFHTLRFCGVDAATGDALFEDVVGGDGLPKTPQCLSEATDSITSADRQIVGSPHPDFTGGLRNTFKLGAFDLNVFAQFSVGNEIFNAVRLFSDAGGWFLDNQLAHVMNRWQQPGDVTDVPRASYDGLSGARVISSRFIEDGTYLRIQDVTLGYRMPASVARLAGFRSARVYVAAHNLVTFTDYMGANPDVNSNGSGATVSLGTEFYSYPLARTFTFGVRGTW